MSRPETNGPNGPNGPNGNGATSVIHDIGYRNYDGARLGRGYLVRSLFAQSLRGAYGLGRPMKSKIMPALLLAAMVFPALIIVVVTIVTKESELEYIEYIPITFYITAIFLAAQAPQLMSHDLRFRTVPLYFSRPLTSSDYVLAKYAALTAALMVLMSSPLLVMYVGLLLADQPFWAETRGVLKALVGVVFFALVLAGLGSVIASTTPRRGFGVASIIAAVMVSYAVVGVVQGIAIETDNPRVALWAELFTPFNLVGSLQLWLFGIKENPVFDELPVPQGAEGLVFLAVALGLIAASFGFLLLRYRKASTR